MGTGHAMRCLALAQLWQDERRAVVFAMADSTQAVTARLRDSGAEVVSLSVPAGGPDDAAQTSDLAAGRNASWVVVDGYQFGAAYQKSLKNAGVKLLFIDDNGHAEHYAADLLLNQNVHAREALYGNREPYTRLLLGPRYALLRPEFGRARRPPRKVPVSAPRLLVSMGGSDPQNVTLKVVRAIAKLPTPLLKVTVVVGGSNPHFAEIAAAAAESPATIQLVQNVTDMAERLSESDLGVLGAGVSSLEACCLGQPAVLIELAPNQHELARRTAELGAAGFLGPSEAVGEAEIAHAMEELIAQPSRRQEMSDKGRALVDGQGAARVVALLQDRMLLRRANPDDCGMLLEWANDPQVRAASFSPAEIGRQEHEVWFRARLSDPASVISIAEEHGVPVGVVRFERVGKRAVLSITVPADKRGQGRGRRMLFLSTEELFQSSQVEVIEAFVKPDNQRSLALFDNAGFQRRRTTTVKGQPAIHFEIHKNPAA
jgi:UDP-2,4-diacetamido-2,4,6-trideoxy-beta-L-altropyranose hydrolase